MFAVHEVVLMASRKDIYWIIIQNESQLVGDSTNGNIHVPKEIIKFVEDVGLTSSL